MSISKYIYLLLFLTIKVHSQPLRKTMWERLKLKSRSWKAEIKDWTGEFWNLVGPPDPTIFEGLNDQEDWVDPLASWEVIQETEQQIIDTKQKIRKQKSKITIEIDNCGSVTERPPTRIVITTEKAATTLHKVDKNSTIILDKLVITDGTVATTKKLTTTTHDQQPKILLIGDHFVIKNVDAKMKTSTKEEIIITRNQQTSDEHSVTTDSSTVIFPTTTTADQVLVTTITEHPIAITTDNHSSFTTKSVGSATATLDYFPEGFTDPSATTTELQKTDRFATTTTQEIMTIATDKLSTAELQTIDHNVTATESVKYLLALPTTELQTTDHLFVIAQSTITEKPLAITHNLLIDHGVNDLLTTTELQATDQIVTTITEGQFTTTTYNYTNEKNGIQPTTELQTTDHLSTTTKNQLTTHEVKSNRDNSSATVNITDPLTTTKLQTTDRADPSTTAKQQIFDQFVSVESTTAGLIMTTTDVSDQLKTTELQTSNHSTTTEFKAANKEQSTIDDFITENVTNDLSTTGLQITNRVATSTTTELQNTDHFSANASTIVEPVMATTDTFVVENVADLLSTTGLQTTDHFDESPTTEQPISDQFVTIEATAKGLSMTDTFTSKDFTDQLTTTELQLIDHFSATEFTAAKEQLTTQGIVLSTIDDFSSDKNVTNSLSTTGLQITNQVATSTTTELHNANHFSANESTMVEQIMATIDNFVAENVSDLLSTTGLQTTDHVDASPTTEQQISDQFVTIEATAKGLSMTENFTSKNFTDQLTTTELQLIDHSGATEFTPAKEQLTTQGIVLSTTDDYTTDENVTNTLSTTGLQITNQRDRMLTTELQNTDHISISGFKTTTSDNFVIENVTDLLSTTRLQTTDHFDASPITTELEISDQYVTIEATTIGLTMANKFTLFKNFTDQLTTTELIDHSTITEFTAAKEQSKIVLSTIDDFITENVTNIFSTTGLQITNQVVTSTTTELQNTDQFSDNESTMVEQIMATTDNFVAKNVSDLLSTTGLQATDHVSLLTTSSDQQITDYLPATTEEIVRTTHNFLIENVTDQLITTTKPTDTSDHFDATESTIAEEQSTEKTRPQKSDYILLAATATTEFITVEKENVLIRESMTTTENSAADLSTTTELHNTDHFFGRQFTIEQTTATTDNSVIENITDLLSTTELQTTDHVDLLTTTEQQIIDDFPVTDELTTMRTTDYFAIENVSDQLMTTTELQTSDHFAATEFAREEEDIATTTKDFISPENVTDILLSTTGLQVIDHTLVTATTEFIAEKENVLMKEYLTTTTDNPLADVLSTTELQRTDDHLKSIPIEEITANLVGKPENDSGFLIKRTTTKPTTSLSFVTKNADHFLVNTKPPTRKSFALDNSRLLFQFPMAR